MTMLYLGKPVYLILAYGFLGAFFMPFLAVTLLWLLNSDRVPQQWRNRLHTNIAMGVIALTFAALAANELYGLVSGT
jgi:Mn2+/Fe2+ NRAMP family transporter